MGARELVDACDLEDQVGVGHRLEAVQQVVHRRPAVGIRHVGQAAPGSVDVQLEAGYRLTQLRRHGRARLVGPSVANLEVLHLPTTAIIWVTISWATEGKISTRSSTVI